MKRNTVSDRFLGYTLLIKAFISVSLILSFERGGAQVYYPGNQPGKAGTIEVGDKVTLSNSILDISLKYTNYLQTISFTNKENNEEHIFAPENLFSFILNTGDSLSADEFEVMAVHSLKGDDKNGSYVGVQMIFSNTKYDITFDLNIKLNDDANYVTQTFEVNAGSQVVNKIYTLKIPQKYKPEAIGKVDGAPVVAGHMFYTIENPMFQVRKGEQTFDLFILPTTENVYDDNHYKESMSIGCFPEGQLRRGFLYYIERVRANPYQQLTFYDSWYDLSYDLNILTEDSCIDRITTWGDSLKARDTRLDCFLWDSGWDDWYNMWEFNKKLPDGFQNINTIAHKYNASSGAWLSPWGGYDEFIKIRLSTAKEVFPQYKINEHGFTLTDPNYYTYFKDIIFRLIRENSVTLFKIDGIDPGKYNPECSGFGNYANEMHAYIRLIKRVREVKADVRLNLTIGTWPSPLWLCYGDNIWRGGADFGALGDGNKRQQWMNYRDYWVYKCLERSPLCPVNSLMFHGITIANYGATVGYEMDDNFIVDDIWAFFSNGTSLQELYINPHRLNSKNWDELAKAIKWSRKHQDVLVDSHWVGGDPSKEEVYGFASWNPKDGTLMLRNPSAKSVGFSFTLNELLELPEVYAGKYSLYNIRKGKDEGIFDSSKEEKISLSPFEIKVMEVKQNN